MQGCGFGLQTLQFGINNPPHGKHVFNHPQAERESKIEPNRVGDHLDGETMTKV